MIVERRFLDFFFISVPLFTQIIKPLNVIVHYIACCHNIFLFIENTIFLWIFNSDKKKISLIKKCLRLIWQGSSLHMQLYYLYFWKRNTGDCGLICILLIKKSLTIFLKSVLVGRCAEWNVTFMLLGPNFEKLFFTIESYQDKQ